MNTQLDSARQGKITDQMRAVAATEGVDATLVQSETARGRLIIPANRNHKNLSPVGIGAALSCKINANIGNSALSSDLDGEMDKLAIAIQSGADAVMDLSTGPDIDCIRRNIVERSTVPVGTVPIYEAAEGVERIEDLSVDALFDTIERHAEQGVDFITVHCGLLKSHIPLAIARTTGIVSRGGALLARWMSKNNKENPLYTEFDRLLEICRRYDMALSLGDGLRPGCIADASDAAQFAELAVLGDLTRRSREAGVQAMVEGPGHVPLNEVEMNVKKQIEICDGAPFYVLGPIVTDIAAGHDHIASAIGGALAGMAGVAMLCYVTPAEHLGLPTADEVRRGVIAHRIAAHAADVARGRPKARARDLAMAKARYALDWEAQFKQMIDPTGARKIWERGRTKNNPAKGTCEAGSEACSMCGPRFCAVRLSRELA